MISITNKYVSQDHYALIDKQGFVIAEDGLDYILEIFDETAGYSIAKVTGSWKINHRVSRVDYYRKKNNRLSFKFEYER